MPRNIAVVGCGAIAQEFHLQAIAKRQNDFDKIWLVDPNENTRQQAFKIVQGEQAASLADVTGDLQFVIVASPNKFHFSVAKEALGRDAHVLIEKPFVIWPNEGRELIELAAERKRIVAVNQTRRFYPNAQELRKRISGGEFGALKKITHFEGSKLAWPYLSGAAFARGAQRTGVIMDIAVHVIDFYQYLLSPVWSFVSAIHDGFDGPEGLGEIRLEANHAPVLIRLSRYETQANIATLEFENARIEMGVFEMSAYSVSSSSGGKNSTRVCRLPFVDFKTLASNVLGNFLDAASGHAKAICEASSSFPVIEILDQVYLHASHFPVAVGKV